MMAGKTTALRKLLAEEAFIHMPVAYDALGGRRDGMSQTRRLAAILAADVAGYPAGEGVSVKELRRRAFRTPLE
jgi:hypothetical protein